MVWYGVVYLESFSTATLIPPVPERLSLTSCVSVLIALQLDQLLVWAIPQAHLVSAFRSMETSHFPAR